MSEPTKDAPHVDRFDEEDAGLIGWEALREAVTDQPEAAPSPTVERALLAKIRVREAETLAPPPSWWTWAWGVAVALLVMALLWATLKPGLVVEWTAQSQVPTTFHLLRSLQGADDFRALHTFEATQAGQPYRYVDIYVWPGQTYVYRVEARDVERVVDRRALVVPGYIALPGQLAVLATGVLVGYGAVILLHREHNL